MPPIHQGCWTLMSCGLNTSVTRDGVCCGGHRPVSIGIWGTAKLYEQLCSSAAMVLHASGATNPRRILEMSCVYNYTAHRLANVHPVPWGQPAQDQFTMTTTLGL